MKQLWLYEKTYYSFIFSRNLAVPQPASRVDTKITLSPIIAVPIMPICGLTTSMRRSKKHRNNRNEQTHKNGINNHRFE